MAKLIMVQSPTEIRGIVYKTPTLHCKEIFMATSLICAGESPLDKGISTILGSVEKIEVGEGISHQLIAIQVDSAYHPLVCPLSSMPGVDKLHRNPLAG